MYHLTKSSFTFDLLFIIVNNNGKKKEYSFTPVSSTRISAHSFIVCLFPILSGNHQLEFDVYSLPREA